MREQARPSAYASFSTRFAGAIAAQSACCAEMPAGERAPDAQVNKAAVRGAQLRGCAKQTEKNRRKIGASLLASVFSGSFSI